jgi:hypothetical protein
VHDKIPKSSFRSIQNYIKNHFYMHVIDKRDIEEDCMREEDESKISFLER